MTIPETIVNFYGYSSFDPHHMPTARNQERFSADSFQWVLMRRYLYDSCNYSDLMILTNESTNRYVDLKLFGFQLKNPTFKLIFGIQCFTLHLFSPWQMSRFVCVYFYFLHLLKLKSNRRFKNKVAYFKKTSVKNALRHND